MHSERSPLMWVWLLLVLMGALVLLFAGCSEAHTSESVNSVSEDVFHRDEQNFDTTQRETVTLLLYDGWQESETEESGNNAYTLTEEDSNTVIDLFYNHKKETVDTPLDSISTVEFRIGNDYLTTSLGDIATLSGRIDGSLVVFSLNENERNLLQQLVCKYAREIPD